MVKPDDDVAAKEHPGGEKRFAQEDNITKKQYYDGKSMVTQEGTKASAFGSSSILRSANDAVVRDLFPSPAARSFQLSAPVHRVVLPVPCPLRDDSAQLQLPPAETVLSNDPLMTKALFVTHLMQYQRERLLPISSQIHTIPHKIVRTWKMTPGTGNSRARLDS